MGCFGAQGLVSSPTYNVLIIGCGNIAGGFDEARVLHLPPLSHAGAYTQHKGFKLIACVDPDEKRRQAFALHWGVQKQAATLVDLEVIPGRYDVISICSPTALHQEHLAQAISLRPRVIFCEKPITSDLAEAAHLVRACREQGITLAVNYSRRWDPSVEEAVSQLQTGRWGAVRSVVGHYNKGILNNGGHMVDLLLRLLGPLELLATTSPVFDYWDIDPTVAALLTAAKGRVPVYLNPGHARDFAYFELEIVCELGVIRMQSGGITWEYRSVVPSTEFIGYKSLDEATQIAGRYSESMARAVGEVYAHLLSGVPIASSGEEAVRVQELCTEIQLDSLMKCKTICKK